MTLWPGGELLWLTSTRMYREHFAGRNCRRLIRRRHAHQQFGATILASAFDVMDAGRMAALQDPTGAVVSVWQSNKHPGGFAVMTDPQGAVFAVFTPAARLTRLHPYVVSGFPSAALRAGSRTVTLRPELFTGSQAGHYVRNFRTIRAR